MRRKKYSITFHKMTGGRNGVMSERVLKRRYFGTERQARNYAEKQKLKKNDVLSLNKVIRRGRKR